MKKVLTIFAAVLMAGQMMAEVLTLAPSVEYSLRPKADGSAFDKKLEANSSNQTFEVNHYARFFAIQQYEVINLANADTLILSLKGNKQWGTDALAIWVAASDWTASDNAESVNTLYQSTTGILPGTAGTCTETYLLKDKSNTKVDIADSNRECTFVIKGDALNTLKTHSSDDLVTLIITNNTTTVEDNSNSKRQYYSSGYATESLRPTLTIKGTGITTALDQIEAGEMRVEKRMINGQLYILRGEQLFDLNGRMVR